MELTPEEEREARAEAEARSEVAQFQQEHEQQQEQYHQDEAAVVVSGPKGGGGDMSVESFKVDVTTSYPTLTVVSDNTAWRTLKMTTTLGIPWFDNNGTGLYYYIYDVTGETLLYTGTICNGASATATCNIDIGKGSYLLRLGGAFTRTAEFISQASLEFCYMKNTNKILPQQTLFFTTDGTECTPQYVYTRDNFCKGVCIFY
jgi:hypothetical protein